MQGGQGNFIFFLLGVLTSFGSPAQEINVNGGFIEDSLLIGDDVNYFITASYPAGLEMVFPDSGYDFSPFEYAAKSYFPTVVDAAVAYDSTVYTIQSYEIDPVQYLQLPVYILTDNDSTILSTPSDSIYFIELAPVVTDTTRLIANADYQSVNRQFNYPLLWIILGTSGVLFILALVIFGKKIIRLFRLKRLKKDHEKFLERLSEYINKLKMSPESSLAEETLTTWKKYQEKLEKYPFTTYTTKEILSRDFASELEHPLKSIDRLVYGKQQMKNVYQDFQQIEDFARHRYLKKVDEIKNER